MPATMDAPCFHLSLDSEQLGELFISTAQMVLSSTGGHAAGVEHALRTAAQFVESINELQQNQ